METTQVNLESLADKWMASIVGTSLTLNTEIHKGIHLGTNIDTGAKLNSYTFLIISAYGSYIVQQRLSTVIGVGNKNEFTKLMREKYLYDLAALDGSKEESWRKAVENTYDASFKNFAASVGPVSNLMKESLKDIFGKYTNLRFESNNLLSKFRQRDSKAYYASMEILDRIVQTIATHFLTLEV